MMRLSQITPARIETALLFLGATAFAALAARFEVLPLTVELRIPLRFAIGVALAAAWIVLLARASASLGALSPRGLTSIPIALCALALIALAVGAPTGAQAAGLAALIATLMVAALPRFPAASGARVGLALGALAAGVGVYAARAAELSPFVLAILAFPVLAGQALVSSAVRARVQDAAIGWAHGAATAHCGLIAFLAAFTPRVALTPPEDIGAWGGVYAGAALLAAAAPVFAIAVLVMVTKRLAGAAGRFARAAEARRAGETP